MSSWAGRCRLLLPTTSFEGSVGGIAFTAGFGIEGGGWTVNLDAC